MQINFPLRTAYIAFHRFWMNGPQVMKPAALVLLVALLCAETVQGLHCYRCLNYTSGKFCDQVMCSFPGGKEVCVSQEQSFTLGSKIVKREDKLCFPDCPKDTDFRSTFSGFHTTVKIMCCNRNLCNAGILVGGNAWTLLGGVLFSLGLAFFWDLL
ncbi:lymphocyte antigen 6S isoform X2 [Cavia porcellus]|uniref:lymphocyte antigen 6S isoform X2 n=1 Tax=Cavia porcellus TaxID=10141 RepID=UPI002FDFE3AC